MPSTSGPGIDSMSSTTGKSSSTGMTGKSSSTGVSSSTGNTSPSTGMSSSTGTMPGQDTLKRDARAIAEEAQNVADEIKTEATTQVGQLADQAKEQLSQATDKVRGLASEQKELLASQVGGVAQAMARAADDLEASDGGNAHYVRMIAENAEKLSSSIRDNSVDELIGMAQDFGRRQPAAFIGAAALLGFAASRFLTASAKRPAEPAQSETTDDTQLPATMSDVGTTDLTAGRL